MKRIIYLTALLISCCYSIVGWGQTPTFGYKATIVTHVQDLITVPNHTTGIYGQVEFEYSDGTKSTHSLSEYGTGIPPQTTTVNNINEQIVKTTIRNRKTADNEESIYITGSEPCLYESSALGTPLFSAASIQFNIQVTIEPDPSNPEFVIYTTSGNGNNISDDAYTSLASHYADEVSEWQYRVGSGTWTTIASTPSLNVRGDMIPDFINLVRQCATIQFRAKHCTMSTESISVYYDSPTSFTGKTTYYSTVLEAKLSLPRIVSHTTVAPSCPNASNGQLILTLNRDLYAGEELSFGAPVSIGGSIGGGTTVTVSNNKTVVLDNIPAGSGTITLELGRIPCSSGSYNGHGGTAQTITYTVPSAATYSFTATSKNVLCYGQNDGGFIVNITGGTATAPYTLSINGSSITLPNSGSHTITGYGAGIYTLDMKDAKGCSPTQTPTTLSRTIIAPTAPTTLSIAAVQHPLEFGVANGSFTLTASGGTGSYNFACTGPAGFSSYTDLNTLHIANAKNGTYTVTLTDGNNCSASTQIQLIEPQLLALTVQLTDTIRCYGQNTAKIQLSATGGYLGATGNYTFSLTRGMAAATPTTNGVYAGLTAGTYYASVTDNNSISKYDTIVVLQPQVLTATVGSANVHCYGGSNGSITLNASGGTTPYTAKFFKNSSLFDENNVLFVDGLSPASYTYTLSDKYGCSYSPTANIVITQPASPVQLLTPNIIQPTFFGANNGRLTIPITGHYGPFEQPMYSVYLYDSLGTVAPASLVDMGSYYAITANSLTAGSYLVRAETDFFGNITYLAATDLRGCFDTLRLYIPQPPRLIPYAVQTDTIRCYGNATAVVNLSAEGGYFSGATNHLFKLGKILSPSDTIWINSSFRPNIVYSGLSAGTYVVAVTDENNIIATKTFIINQPNALELQYQLSHVHCFGGSDGKIILLPAGGTIPYSFIVTAPVGSTGTHTVNSSYTLNQLASGTYHISYTDKYNCAAASATNLYVITAPANSVSLSIAQQTNPRAFGYTDGVIEANINGGTPATTGYEWTWINRATGLTPNNIQSDGFYLMNTQLGDGYYQLAVYDSLYTSVNSGLPADLRGCFDTLSVKLTEPPLLKVNVMLQDSIRCNGFAAGAIYYSGEGGYLNTSENYRYRVGRYNGPGNINWMQNYSASNSFTRLPAGSYSVEVIDGNNITSQTIINIPEPDAFNVSLNVTPSACGSNPTGALTALVTGATPPYNYVWFSSGNEEYLTATASLTNVPGGIYFLKITDKWDCLYTDYVVVPNTGMKISPTLIHPSCHNSDNGAINLTISNGQAPYQYRWNNGTMETTTGTIAFGNLSAGTYNLTISDAQGCAETHTFTLLNPDSRSIDNMPGTVAICQNQCFTAIPDCPDAQLFFWYKNDVLCSQENQLTVCDAGDYRLKIIIDIQNNCAVEHPFKVIKLSHEVSVAFTVASKVAIYKEIKIVNISYPEPEQQEWILPTDRTAFSILSQTKELLTVEFYKTGTYTFGLTGQTGGCAVTKTKDVEVVYEYDLPYEPDSESPFILQFSVYPNPVTAHQMNIHIELRERADITLRLYDITGVQHWSKTLQGNSVYSFTETIPGLSSGWYLLLLTAGNETSSRTIIVQ